VLTWETKTWRLHLLAIREFLMPLVNAMVAGEQFEKELESRGALELGYWAGRRLLPLECSFIFR
jgi:hypothetical protein